MTPCQGRIHEGEDRPPATRVVAAHGTSYEHMGRTYVPTDQATRVNLCSTCELDYLAEYTAAHGGASSWPIRERLMGEFRHALLTSDPAELEEAKELMLRLARGGRNRMRGTEWANAQLAEFTRVAKREHWNAEQQLAMALAFVAGKDLGPQLGTFVAAAAGGATEDHPVHRENHAARDGLTHEHENGG